MAWYNQLASLLGYCNGKGKITIWLQQVFISLIVTLPSRKRYKIIKILPHFKTTSNSYNFYIGCAPVTNDIDQWNIAFQTSMKCANPKQMLKLKTVCSSSFKLLNIMNHYWKNFIFDNLNEVLKVIKANRIMVMTNGRLTEIVLAGFPKHHFIKLCNVNTANNFEDILKSIKPSQLADPLFYLIIQYDATTDPVILFHHTQQIIIVGQKIKMKNL